MASLGCERSIGTRFGMGGDSDLTIWYMQQVVGWQPRLYAFVLSLTGNPNEADDVLQNTNLVLLKKREAFRPDADFGAWAMQIARFEVQRFREFNARVRGDSTTCWSSSWRPGRGRLAAIRSGVEGLAIVHVASVAAGARDAYSPLRRQFGGRDRREMGALGGLHLPNLYRVRGKLAECVKRALNAERQDEL